MSHLRGLAVVAVCCVVVGASLWTPRVAEAKKKMPVVEPAVEPVKAAPPSFWEASMTLPQDQKLEFNFFIDQDPSGAWVGTISIPAQLVDGMPLADVSLSGDTLTWAMPLPKVPAAAWPKASLTLTPDRAKATGTFTQSGMSFPLTAAASDPLKLRPQTPQPPFPYTSREVSIPNLSDPKAPITLTGTLTVPPGKGPHPAVLLITGSGQQDRDESIFGHKPFWVLADHLSRHGVAVLRVDDRGKGGSTMGDLANATTLTFATDADAALDFLKTQPDIDAARLGTIGHSEGGLISILLAARREDIAFSVLLAASALPGFDILLRQNADTFRAQGASEEAVQAVVDAQRVSLQSVIDHKDEATQLAALTAVIRAQSAASIPAPPTQPSDADFAEAAKLHLKALQSPWIYTFLTLDPRAHLPKIKTPVLALNGTLDTQVAHEPNLAAIRDGLAAAHNTHLTTHALPNLNHLFQTATTGHLSEYATIRETFSPAALTLISDWLAAQAKLP
jgi:uncharacterized protein